MFDITQIENGFSRLSGDSPLWITQAFQFRLFPEKELVIELLDFSMTVNLITKKRDLTLVNFIDHYTALKMVDGDDLTVKITRLETTSSVQTVMERNQYRFCDVSLVSHVFGESVASHQLSTDDTTGVHKLVLKFADIHFERF